MSEQESGQVSEQEKEEKIKVGEYIRTKNGIIAKVTYVDGLMLDTDNDVFDVGGAMMMEIPTEFIEEYVAKHSKDIIDLIEVGDVVEIYLRPDLKAKEFRQKYEILSQEMIEEVKKDTISIEYLASILTHEMYEKNCYKVGDIE